MDSECVSGCMTFVMEGFVLSWSNNSPKNGSRAKLSYLDIDWAEAWSLKPLLWDLIGPSFPL